MKHYYYGNCSASANDEYIVYAIPESSGGAAVVAQVLITVTALLSIAGCLLIIVTYIAYKDLRTTPRAMLVHLSIADLILSSSRIFGLYVNHLGYSNKYGDFLPSLLHNSTNDPRCYTQAAFTAFSSIASLLWSNSIGIYMVVLILTYNKSKKRNTIIYAVACCICWFIPLIIIIVDGALKLFGLLVITMTGCYIMSALFTSNDTILHYKMAELFSYDIWVYLSLLLLPVLYSVLFYFTHCKFKPQAMKVWKLSPDVKLLLVPIIFILTRVWSVVLRSMIYYHSNGDFVNGCSSEMKIMVIIDGVGINAQGVVNAVLFCFFTRPVRMRLWRSCKQVYRRLCCCILEKEREEEKPPTEWDALKELTTSSYESLD